MTQNAAPTPPSGSSYDSRVAWVIIGILVLLVVALLAAATIVAVRLVAYGSEDAPAPPASSSPSASSPASSPSASPARTPKPTGSASAAPAPVPDGPWQQVVSDKDEMAYDVPPDWEPGPGALAGFESPQGEITALMHGITTYGDDWCDDNWHTLVGFVTPGSISDKGSIEATAMHWAKAAAQDDGGENPTGSLGEPREVKVDGGRTVARAVTASATPLDQTCPVPSIEVTVVSVPKKSGEALFVVVADRGAEGSNPDAALAKVIASVRPVR
ncbi:cytoskeletal protein RodZ [Nocardioides luteus]|uniref:DUF8017 domain-containing protein n=1 Tax=Nocardioides luteus TaxID=1844 RepID=A0ABQ5SYT1_9ACTN|nr:hypothetical protein [Nocardioides luteus]MDR7312713.1 cytoskeletal protein RodZ [Nocardioides luteus]GGR47055.1 hypothetical protein GCM10010197_11020 [Nocardioides luteus]GLJ68966.1 hypothetical protein GCM10017579_30020 [Nocardioides luteus]